MAGFKYRLESLLKIKKQVEEIKKEEYAKSIMEVEKEKLKLVNINNDLLLNSQKMNSSAENGTTIANLRTYSSYLFHLKNKKENQKINVDVANEISDIKRVELVNAVQQREIFDKHKEIKKVEYFNEEKHKEQKLVDEIITYKIFKEENN